MKERAILVSDNHTIGGHAKIELAYYFWIIDSKIWKYVKTKNVDDLEIIKYIESEDYNSKFKYINFVNSVESIVYMCVYQDV